MDQHVTATLGILLSLTDILSNKTLLNFLLQSIGISGGIWLESKVTGDLYYRLTCNENGKFTFGDGSISTDSNVSFYHSTIKT